MRRAFFLILIFLFQQKISFSQNEKVSVAYTDAIVSEVNVGVVVLSNDLKHAPENSGLLSDSGFNANNYSNDSLLLIGYENYYDSLFARDSTGFEVYNSGIVYSPDRKIKAINLFIESSGGATYNPSADNCLVRYGKIYETNLEGEIFRIDLNPDSSYTLYVNNITRMGNYFSFFNLLFKNDTAHISNTDKYGNYFFDLIREKKQKIDEVNPKTKLYVDTYNSFMGKIDTTKEYYKYYVLPNDLSFLKVESEDPDFRDEFSKEPERPVFRVSYLDSYGDQIEKILRVVSDSTKDIVLAMKGGDSNSYEMTSEFVNDSTFVQYFVNKDGEDGSYTYDSLVTRFSYDKKFNFVKLSVDSFSYSKKFEIINNAEKEVQSISYSRLFRMNSIDCKWKFTVDYTYDDSGKSIGASNFKMQLINAVNDSVVLDAKEDIVNNDRIEIFSMRIEKFSDINFDGYDDFQLYKFNESGSGGDYYEAYVFDPLKNKYEFVEELSGTNPSINSKDRSVSFYGHSGYGFNSTQKVFFDKSGKISYTELTKEEMISDDDIKITYIRKVKGKIVKQKTEIVKREQN